MQNIGPVSALGGAIISDVPTAQGQMAVKPIVTKNGVIWEGPRVIKQEAAACCHAICVSVSGIQSEKPLIGLGHDGPGSESVRRQPKLRPRGAQKTHADAVRRRCVEMP